ncbi:MAG: hypothetical protein JWQ62_259, partial [Lacunisphaera sp.]|nr:hypothetical protein [Lacunisphaera sp.]
MNAHFVPTSFRCLHGFLILAIVVVLFDPLRAAQELYTNTYSWSYSSVPGYGEVVATNRDTVLIGNHQSSSASASNLRDVTELARGGSGWILQQTFQVPNWGVFQASGDTLAAGDTLFARAGGSWAAQGVIPEAKEAVAVALQGDTVVYGIPVHSLAPGAFQTDGSVIICQRSGTAWSKQATLVPSQSYQRFGTAVALDGDTLLAATGDGSAPGRVYAYRRSGSSWSLEGSLGFPDQGDWPRLAIEGDTAVVGDGSKDRVGIFTRSGTTWSLQQTIAYAPSNPNGYVLDVRVALKNGVLAVATEGDAKVYLYTRTSSGWLLVQTVSGSFAALHALTETGDALVVGDPDNRLARMSFTPRPPAPGSGWRDYDVGAVGGAGSSSDDGTTVTVRGSGPDIWDRLDQFHFRSETMTGDGAIVARVTSAGTTHPWAKVGLMFRENVASASREVTAFVTPGAHVGTAVRASPADYTAFQDAGWSGAPIWLMLARSGNLFASYRSDDGDHWTPMGSATVSMPATIHVGLAVASHYAGGELNIGTFTNVELVGLPPPPNDPPAAPTNLQAGNQTATTAALSWTDNSNDETGFEIQRATGDGSGTFTVVTTTAANASSYIDSGLTADTQYTYRVRAVRNGTFSANSNTFTVRTLTNTNTGWASADIGNVGVAGSTSASGAAVTLNAGGEDIWNQADGFRFYYSRWSGDGSVTAHVSALTNTHPWAKAGVMIRESLNAGAAHATMVLTADNVCGFITRSSAGAAAEFVGGPWLNAPYWVRVTRSGNLFSGYISPDGVTWTLVGSKTMAMGSPVYVGVAGSSHNTAAQTSISCGNISVSSPGLTPPAAPSDLHATNITANGAHLTWTDNSNNEDGFRIYAEDDTPQAGFQRVGATAANATSLDVGLQSSRHYYIIVASFRGTTETWSDAITVTTPPSPDTPPPAPPHIAVDPDASNSLRVAWDDVSTTETGFEIERASGGGAFALVGSSGANVAYYSDAGLTAGTGYSYRVRAMNGSSASGYSPVGTATAVAAPTAPSGLVVDGPTDTTLHLSWTDRSNDERGFELMRATGNGTFDKQILLAANTTSYTDTGLTPGTTYSYKVQASAYFTSGYSNTVTGSTAGGPPPPPPGSWTGYDIGNTGSSGSDSGSAPTVTMNAGGADIYGTADGFHGLFSSAEG